MRRVLTIVFCLGLAACAEDFSGLERSDNDLLGATSMQEAAIRAERAYGVPADLVLALAYAETRWQVPTAADLGVDLSPDARLEDGEAHPPSVVGVGGIMPWHPADLIGAAEETLAVDREAIATDPMLGILATAVSLRVLAEARYGADVPSAMAIESWHEVVADYGAIDDEASRASYAWSVYRYLQEGISGDAADGTFITLEARDIELPEQVRWQTWAAGAEYPSARWSPADPSNHSVGRRGQAIRYIIIHTVQGSYGGAVSWFRNPAANVSAHFVVRSSDGEVTQMLSENDPGWHAGNWDYNLRSIGIEHEGYVADPGRWYSDAMYASSANLVRFFAARHDIPLDRDHIIGHNEVPNPYVPGRFGGSGGHTDPGGGWDWDRFMALVRSEPAPTPAPEPAPVPPPAPPPPTPTPVTPSRPFAAELVAVHGPSELAPGAQGTVYVDLRNTGSQTWTPGPTRLGTQYGQDHSSAFYTAGSWITQNRPSDVDATVRSGEVGRFTFTITAPAATATTVRTEYLQPVQEWVTWFGPVVTFRVTVRPAASPPPPPPPPVTRPSYGGSIVTVNVPATMTAGSQATGYVEYRNTGSRTWTRGITRVGTTDPRDHHSRFHTSTDWLEPNRPSDVDGDVGPDGVGRFSFVLTAPEVATETTFVENLRPVQEGVTWFGENGTFRIRITPR